LGDHRLWTSHGVANAELRPTELLLEAGLGGSFNVPDIGLKEFPKLLNVERHPGWGADLFQFFPNYVIFIYASNIMFTYQYWPLDVDHHIFEGRTYYVPPRNASERLAQEISNVSFKEYWLQDANALESCYGMLKSRAKMRFPLSDQEIQIRHFHKVVNEYIDAYRRECNGSGKGKTNGHR
jgi:glycine betaine catabolism A